LIGDSEEYSKLARRFEAIEVEEMMLTALASDSQAIGEKRLRLREGNGKSMTQRRIYL
jgi:hypothetical protein